MNTIHKQIQEKKQELAELERRLEIENNALTDDRNLADFLHENLCHWNHVDGCGYYYETWEKPVHQVRTEWQARAQRILIVLNKYSLNDKCGMELIRAILNL